MLLYWIPPTSGQESRMLYAGALEQFRDKAGVSKYVLPILTYDIQKLCSVELILNVEFLMFFWLSWN